MMCEVPTDPASVHGSCEKASIFEALQTCNFLYPETFGTSSASRHSSGRSPLQSCGAARRAASRPLWELDILQCPGRPPTPPPPKTRVMVLHESWLMVSSTRLRRRRTILEQAHEGSITGLELDSRACETRPLDKTLQRRWHTTFVETVLSALLAVLRPT